MENVSIRRRIEIREIAQKLSPEVRKEFLTRFDMKVFAKIFEDSEMCTACRTFIDCGLNLSQTARAMYMHRNTLMYRLNKVKDATGLDLNVFADATTFELLYYLYKQKMIEMQKDEEEKGE